MICIQTFTIELSSSFELEHPPQVLPRGNRISNWCTGFRLSTVLVFGSQLPQKNIPCSFHSRNRSRSQLNTLSNGLVTAVSEVLLSTFNFLLSTLVNLALFYLSRINQNSEIGEPAIFFYILYIHWASTYMEPINTREKF